MNWAASGIGIALIAQALSPAFAQSSCNDAVEGCEVQGKTISSDKNVPKPRRKPAPRVALNTSEPIQTQLLSAEPPVCQTMLKSLGGDFSVPIDVATSGECQVSDPIQLTSLMTSLGPIELPAKPILRCDFALQFSTWASTIAAPVVAGLSEAKLVAISTNPGYECRNRNGDSSGKISEHAFGNAIDIDGLVLSNRTRIEISDASIQDHPNHRLLAALRMAACGYFTTVLGPGSNAAHESHFHFDLGKHGNSGNYRICE